VSFQTRFRDGGMSTEMNNDSETPVCPTINHESPGAQQEQEEDQEEEHEEEQDLPIEINNFHPAVFNSMLYELILNKANNIDPNSKPEVKNPETDPRAIVVSKWLLDQRKHYKNWAEGKPSDMNAERAKVLETLGVKWHVRGETFWDKQFAMLHKYKVEFGTSI